MCALAGEVGFALLAVPVLRPLGPRLLSATVCGRAAAEAAAAGLVMDGTARLRRSDATETGALLWQAAVVTVVVFVCWSMGVRRLGAERATLFSGLIPVAAARTAPLVATGSYGAPGRGQRPGRRRSRRRLRRADREAAGLSGCRRG
ncbi:hypothetical protein [Streptomyces sp. NPDC020996]|uniref:hypothetical protein n=1 Tax=Streptomyces sp. NPDC020996 TaxID=3154791 RepID=UPI0033F0FE1A